jgi:hypothetical protein
MNNKKQKALALLLYLRQQKKKRQFWVHPIHQDRKRYGAYYTLLPQLEADPVKFFNYFRMKKECFDLLLSKVENRYKKL